MATLRAPVVLAGRLGDSSFGAFLRLPFIPAPSRRSLSRFFKTDGLTSIPPFASIATIAGQP